MKGSAVLAIMALLATSSSAMRHKHVKSRNSSPDQWTLEKVRAFNTTTTIEPPVITSFAPSPTASNKEPTPEPTTQSIVVTTDTPLTKPPATTPSPPPPATTPPPPPPATTPPPPPATTPPPPPATTPPPPPAPTKTPPPEPTPSPVTTSPPTTKPPATATSPGTSPPDSTAESTPAPSTAESTPAPSTTEQPTTTPVPTDLPLTSDVPMTTPRPSETRSPATNVPSTTVTPDLDMNSTPTSPAMGVPLSGAPGPADDKNKAQNEAAGGSENDGGMTGMELFAIAGGALCAIVLMMVVVVARRRRNMSASKEGSVNRWTDNGAFLTSRRNALLLQPPTTSQHPRALDTMDMLNMLQTDTRTKSVRFASDILNHPRTLNSMDSNILNDVDDSIQTSETPRLSSAWSIGTSELCISQGEDQPSTWTMTDQPLEDIEEASADDDISSAFSSSMGGSLTFSPSSQGTSWSGSSDISVEHHTARDFMSTASSFDSNDLMDTSRYLDMIHADVHVAEDV